MSPTILDFILIGVVLLSTILAFARGFMRELLTLIAWAGAAAAAWFLLPYTEPYARQIVDDELIARIIAAAVVFIVVLIVITVIASLITGRVRDSNLSFFDRILGGLFGVVRGVLLMVLGYVLLTLVYPDDSKTPWIRDAVSKSYLESGKGALERVLPEGILKRGKQAAQDLRKGAEIKKKADELQKQQDGEEKPDGSDKKPEGTQ